MIKGEYAFELFAIKVKKCFQYLIERKNMTFIIFSSNSSQLLKLRSFLTLHHGNHIHNARCKFGSSTIFFSVILMGNKNRTIRRRLHTFRANLIRR